MPTCTAAFTRWLERYKSTARWRGFLAWLSLDLPRWLPMPTSPTQPWKRLPLRAVRQTAESVHPWLLTVLQERQQRGLGWNEANDAPALAADLAIQPLTVADDYTRPGWLLWHVRNELARLIRLCEAPEPLLPRGAGMPCEARYRALAVGLLRLRQAYAALEVGQEREEAAAQWCAAAARARQRATAAPAAAA